MHTSVNKGLKKFVTAYDKRRYYAKLAVCKIVIHYRLDEIKIVRQKFVKLWIFGHVKQSFFRRKYAKKTFRGNAAVLCTVYTVHCTCLTIIIPPFKLLKTLID